MKMSLNNRINKTSLKIMLMTMLMALVTCAAFFVPASADIKYSTWDEYSDANGLKEYTYNNVTDAIDEVLTSAVESYKAGDGDAALKKVSDAKNPRRQPRLILLLLTRQ